MAPGIGLCGPKTSRKYLIIVNFLTALSGTIFLIIGGVSLSQGQSFNTAIDSFCGNNCVRLGCKSQACSTISVCDCSTSKGILPTYFFTAPASGLIAVGVFSLIAAVLGCFSAIRMRGAWLCGYIIAVAFVVILQFAFGIAAATLGNMERIPNAMEEIITNDFDQIDWKYFSTMLPQACYAAKSQYVEQDIVVYHPACFWNGSCIPSSTEYMQTKWNVNCCAANNVCNTASYGDKCRSPEMCISGFLYNVGTPVAVAALLTLVLQLAAIWWACIVRRETRPGGVFDPKANQL